MTNSGVTDFIYIIQNFSSDEASVDIVCVQTAEIEGCVLFKIRSISCACEALTLNSESVQSVLNKRYVRSGCVFC